VGVADWAVRLLVLELDAVVRLVYDAIRYGSFIFVGVPRPCLCREIVGAVHPEQAYRLEVAPIGCDVHR